MLGNLPLCLYSDFNKWVTKTHVSLKLRKIKFYFFNIKISKLTEYFLIFCMTKTHKTHSYSTLSAYENRKKSHLSHMTKSHWQVWIRPQWQVKHRFWRFKKEKILYCDIFSVFNYRNHYSDLINRFFNVTHYQFCVYLVNINISEQMLHTQNKHEWTHLNV